MDRCVYILLLSNLLLELNFSNIKELKPLPD